ncbi:hypothetical protein ACFWWC_11450 [Streptomyces sp. NPDC058642]|uniref:hypothetical protein n=1 Tax=Streptomyces sp. NPDC058642 TaxID=3346572 RepID=UPI0036548309
MRAHLEQHKIVTTGFAHRADGRFLEPETVDIVLHTDPAHIGTPRPTTDVLLTVNRTRAP